MTIQRGSLTRTIAVVAALVAALALTSVPASAAPSTAAAQVAAFPDGSWRIKNPSQQNRCITPAATYVGAVPLRACDDVRQYFIEFTWEGDTELLPLYGQAGDGYSKCLAADSANRVYLKTCDSTANTYWTRIGNTIKNDATARCLSGNSAGTVYTAVCDGAANRNWTFPTTLTAAAAPADANAAQALRDARRAELTRAAG